MPRVHVVCAFPVAGVTQLLLSLSLQLSPFSLDDGVFGGERFFEERSQLLWQMERDALAARLRTASPSSYGSKSSWLEGAEVAKAALGEATAWVDTPIGEPLSFLPAQASRKIRPYPATQPAVHHAANPASALHSRSAAATGKVLISTISSKAFDTVTQTSDGGPITEELVSYEFEKYKSDADTEYRRLLGGRSAAARLPETMASAPCEGTAS